MTNISNLYPERLESNVRHLKIENGGFYMNKNKNGIPKVTKTHRNTFRPVERPVHNEKVLDGPYKSFDLMRGTRMVEMVYKAVNTVTASFIMPYNRKKVDEYKLDGWSISNVWNNE